MLFLAEIPELGPFAIEHPETLLATIIGFVLLLFVVSKMPSSIPLGFPFLRETLNDRAGRIEEAQSQVQRALDDTKRLHDDYASRLHRIEEEARDRIDAAVREADSVRGEIIAEAEQTAQQIRRRSEEEISRERTRQRILLRRQIVQLTLDAAEQSVTAFAQEKVQRQLIQDFIVRAATDGQTVTVPAEGKGA